MTPFEEAGYTKDTKFKVLHGYSEITPGEIVTLNEDDGSILPYFVNEYGEVTCFYLPSYGNELEVYVEDSDEGSPVEAITQDEVDLGNIKSDIPEWLGVEGSQRYNLIRTLCKVMDGDKCKESSVLMDDYQDIYAHPQHLNPIVKCATILYDLGSEFILQSEDKEVIEAKRKLKLAKIKEVEDTLAKLKDEMEDL